jgi:glycosidase
MTASQPDANTPMPGDRPLARHRRWASAVVAAVAACSATVAAAAGPRLHVPSPDWRDQVIYFAMTDRFDDGDSKNNDQRAGEFNRAREDRYQGGDLRGLARRLNYIRGLGATALWITPPVANQWIGPSGPNDGGAGGHGGYHGYWAEHFMQVDKHLGTLADYQRLSRQLHQRGMVLVQDIVLNHTGNYFGQDGPWSAADPSAHMVRYLSTPPVPAPRQAPFNLNDARDPAQRAAAIYHWTPDVADYTDPVQERNFQMSGLDDLNTENPVVMRALRRSYAHWIRAAGVDAFRVDTAFYVPPETFADFLYSRDAQAPGVMQVARQTGRRQFHVFGEGFGIDKPGETAQARKIESYMTDAAGRPLLPGMLNFPLYGALNDAFARGQASAVLGKRIASLALTHARPHLMANFVDNHDVDRFLRAGSQPALRQALLAMFTLPGIPTLYYGTEQAFTEQRASMFAGGWGAGGRDHFDVQAPLYRYIAGAAALRRTHRLFSRGTPQLLRDNPNGPGALAYLMVHGQQRALVVFNTAEQPVLLDRLPLGAGVRLKGLFGVDGSPADAQADAAGTVNLVLPPRAGQVWLLQAPGRSASVETCPTIQMTGDGSATAAEPTVVTGDFAMAGTVPPAAATIDWRLVVDGDLARAVRVQPQPDGRWQAEVDTGAMIEPAVTHRAVLWASGCAGPAQPFRVERRWTPVVDQADPAEDDHGPGGQQGQYAYPTDPSYAGQRAMDIRRVQVAGAGGALQLDITLADISTRWNPANGLDHVALTLFIELPGTEGGVRAMPLQDGELPGTMRWHRRLRVHGWSNALFSADGASATHEGTPVTPGASIQVDAAAKRLRLTLPAAALGNLRSLSGARLYLNTWDYDNGYRPLAPTPQPWAMGGGAPGSAPKVMDDVVVITLP